MRPALTPGANFRPPDTIDIGGHYDVGQSVKAPLQRPRDHGMTVSGALFVTPLAATRIAGVVTAVTLFVRTANAAAVVPAANVTVVVVGAATAAFVLVSVAVNPPGGAAHAIVAAPLTLDPPVTADGVNVTAVKRMARTLSASCFETPPYEAANTPDVNACTASAVTVIVALVWPGATVTAAGMCTPLVVVDSSTRAPTAGAGPVSVTLAVEV